MLYRFFLFSAILGTVAFSGAQYTGYSFLGASAQKHAPGQPRQPGGSGSGSPGYRSGGYGGAHK
jgi:hypothetical protein